MVIGLSVDGLSQNSFSDFYIQGNYYNFNSCYPFYLDCRVHASKVMAIVMEYKQANQQIAFKCRSISESLLVNINNKRVYEELQFKDDQLQHKEEVINLQAYLTYILCSGFIKTV